MKSLPSSETPIPKYQNSLTNLNPNLRKVQLNSLNLYELIPAKRRVHQLDPMAWYRERWLGDPKDFKWSAHAGYENHQWDGTPDPLLTAWEHIASGIWTAVESGTSLGKTFMASIIVYWWLDVWPESTVVLIGHDYTQLKLTLGAEIKKKFHKLKLLHPNAKYYDSLQIVMDQADFEKSKWKMFGKGIEVKANEKLNVGAAGVHAENMLYILDEAAGIPHSIYASVINTSTAPNNMILALGNPNSQSDPLHEFALRHGVKHVQVSAYDHPNVVTNKILFPGAVSVDSIRMRAGKEGQDMESPEFKSRVRGLSPKEAANSLFKRAWFDDAERRGMDKNFVPDPYGENALGVDVANSMKGDKGACCYGESNMVTELVEFVCPNATHLGYSLIYGDDWPQAPESYKGYGLTTFLDAGIWDENIAIDGNGVGSGTVTAFTDAGYKIYNVIGGQDKDAIEQDAEGKPLHSFINLRAQVIWTLAEEMRRGEIAFGPKVDRQMIKDLRHECLVIDRMEGKASIQIESKDDIKRKLGGKSPNLLDAFAYWNWRRKDRRSESGGGVSI